MKMRIKMPKAPRLRMKMPRIKMKVPAMHFPDIGSGFSKMAKGFISPFEQMGRSATGLLTGTMDSATGLLTGTMDSATGLVDNVAQAAGNMAPDLLQKGLAAGADMLLPGSGGLVSSLLNSASQSDTTSDDSNPQSQTQRALTPWSDAISQIQQATNQAEQPQPESPIKKYAIPLTIGGLALAYVVLNGNKKGKR